MIYDNLSNIELYQTFSADIYEGLTFLKQANLSISNGVYQINPRVKSIVSEYETKSQNANGYEAHKQYIDIQCILSGIERVACLPIEELQETKPYSEESDCALYSADTILQPSNLILKPGYFAIFFPQDGHMPGLSATSPEHVKKVVVKVRCW